jgi:uncharacterized membrane-anchored protein YhcB (DUF1043 family)
MADLVVGVVIGTVNGRFAKQKIFGGHLYCREY